jgi:hypothetical protein
MMTSGGIVRGADERAPAGIGAQARRCRFLIIIAITFSGLARRAIVLYILGREWREVPPHFPA